MKIQVQAITVNGMDGAWRAGRKWPSGSPVTVDVIDSQDDPPPVTETVGDGKTRATREVPDYTKIGQKTFEALKADPRIRILQEGAVADLKAAEVRIAELEKTNAELKARIAELEGAAKGHKK